jgi:hypothetical protein
MPVLTYLGPFTENCWVDVGIATWVSELSKANDEFFAVGCFGSQEHEAIDQ